jgi:nitrate reductase NapE component
MKEGDCTPLANREWKSLHFFLAISFYQVISANVIGAFLVYDPEKMRKHKNKFEVI